MIDLENYKLPEIFSLKGGTDTIYGEGVFEQTLGKDAS